MLIIYSYLTQLYNIELLSVAVIVALVSIIDAFGMLRRARLSEGKLKSAWLFGAALVFGVGIWALHFITILAYNPGVSISFDWELVSGSLISAVLIAWIGFGIGLYGNGRTYFAYLAGATLGVAGLVMLGCGMEALRVAGVVTYQPLWILAALAAAGSFSVSGNVISKRWPNVWGDFAAAIIIGAGMALMNFCGINAMRILPLDIPMTPGLTLNPMNFSILIAGVGLMLTVSLGFIGAQFDAYLYRRLNAESDRARRLADAAFEGILVHSKGHILEVNLALATLLGREQNSLAGADFIEVAHPSDEDLPALAAELLSPTFHTHEITIRSEDGAAHIVELISRPLCHNDASATVTAIRDITARKADELRISYLAYHDQLTGLANRTLFTERLEQAIDIADRLGNSAALLTLDLDRFKAINDKLGHAAGDQVLAQAATRLSQMIRDVDTAARLGGDEFAIIQSNVSVPDGPSVLADRLIAAFSEPFNIDGNSVNIGISIGIALYPTHAINSDLLLKASDIALYKAKNAGRGGICIFSPIAYAAE